MINPLLAMMGLEVLSILFALVAVFFFGVFIGGILGRLEGEGLKKEAQAKIDAFLAEVGPIITIPLVKCSLCGNLNAPSEEPVQLCLICRTPLYPKDRVEGFVCKKPKKEAR
jgi:hypothetical protein